MHLIKSATPPVFAGRPVFRGGMWQVLRGDDRWRIGFTREGRGPTLVDRVADSWTLYHDGEWDRLAAHCLRLVWAWELAGRNGLVVHSVSFSINGAGVMAVGGSGAGKSTLATLLEAHSPGSVLCDDRAVVRAQERGLRVFGTPWCSSAEISRPASAPLKVVLLLEHAPRNELLPITTSEAMESVLSATTVFWFESSLRDAALVTLDRVMRNVKCYRLRFRPDSGAAELLDELCRQSGD